MSDLIIPMENHLEAKELANIRYNDSNLARCYLALDKELTQIQKSFDGYVYVTNEEYDELCQAAKERDELKTGFDLEGNTAAESCCNKIKKDLVEQRDMLVETLKEICNIKYGRNSGFDLKNIAEKALATINEEKQ